MSDLTREQAYRRWKKGEDQHALAKEMGVTRERMRHILKKMDENVPLVDRVEELEAKLAKALALALDECPFRWGTPSYGEWWHHRRTTLAELKGD